MKRFTETAIALLLVLLALPFAAVPALAAEGEEPTVRVGYMNHPGFIEEQEDGTLNGYGVDFINEVCKHTGWKAEYIYASWAEQLEMLRRGELDIIPMAGYSEERAQSFVFSRQAIGTVQCLLTVKADNADIYYEDFAHMDGKRIGVQRSSEGISLLEHYAAKNGFSYRLWEYDFLEEAMDALMAGEIDLIASEQLTNQADIRIVAHLGSAPIYCMTSRENASLIEEINEAINMIFTEDVTFRSRIYQRYYGNSILYRQPAFTREEVEFAASVGEVEIALLPDSQPSSYVDQDGNVVGIVPDILNDISAQSGIRFRYSFVPLGEKPLVYMKKNPELLLGGVLSINPAFQDESLLVFDDFHISNAALLTSGSDDQKLDLRSGSYVIGTLQAFQAMQLYLHEQYPNLTVVSDFLTVEDGFAALQRGEIDLFTYDFNMILHYWGNPRYTDIRVISTTFLEEPQCIVGINTPENQMLMGIVNKCVATISADRNAEIERFHLSKNFHEPTLRDTLYRFRWSILVGLLGILLLVVVFLMAKRRSAKSAEVIRQKNLALAEAVERAEQASHAKSEFLSSMSHDIRTPMNAITGMTEIALRRGSDAAQMRRCLEKIRLSSFHLLALINDILDISKIESGKMSLNIAEFSLVELSEILIGLTREQAQEKKIDLRVHTHHFDQEHLLGDALRIRQVCINLISNAIKYTPEGGAVDIDFRQEAVPEAPNKVRMVCTVKDTGIGMSQEFQAVMYESFARATDNRVNKIPGSGLGLPICRRMVELMDGTLECESELGKGTAFTVSILLERGRPDEAYRLPPMRLLAVDHDAVSSSALSRILERLGITADIVNTPEELDELLRKNRPYQAAMVELHAPTQSGLAAVGVLRERYGAELPILLTDIGDMTAFSGQITALGITQTLSKPYFYRTVYQALCQLLDTAEYSGEHRQEPEEQSIAGMHVLAAEDNDMNWDILHELLELYGVTAERAENGRLCLEKLEAAMPGQYAAVLMDGRMPEMDGLEATRRIRSSEKAWLRVIPVVAMTADAFSEDIQNYLSAGADAHLAKPLDVQRLLTILFNIRNKCPISGGGVRL